MAISDGTSTRFGRLEYLAKLFPMPACRFNCSVLAESGHKRNEEHVSIHAHVNVLRPFSSPETWFCGRTRPMRAPCEDWLSTVGEQRHLLKLLDEAHYTIPSLMTSLNLPGLDDGPQEILATTLR